MARQTIGNFKLKKAVISKKCSSVLEMIYLSEDVPQFNDGSTLTIDGRPSAF
jgi:hypothetical protein